MFSFLLKCKCSREPNRKEGLLPMVGCYKLSTYKRGVCVYWRLFYSKSKIQSLQSRLGGYGFGLLFSTVYFFVFLRLIVIGRMRRLF